MMLPVSELHDFPGHPFQVRDDEEMEKLVESITQHGVLMPGLVRPRAAGGYEIVAGHRRKTALVCTPRAQEVIRRGRQLQTAFFDSLFRGMEPPLRTAFIDAMQIIDSNLDQLLREER